MGDFKGIWSCYLWNWINWFVGFIVEFIRNSTEIGGEISVSLFLLKFCFRVIVSIHMVFILHTVPCHKSAAPSYLYVLGEAKAENPEGSGVFPRCMSISGCYVAHTPQEIWRPENPPVWQSNKTEGKLETLRKQRPTCAALAGKSGLC